MHSWTTTNERLVSEFEDDQKIVVFTALGEYLRFGSFTDITICCQNKLIRAHKLILAASCKFFRDAFKHDPGLNVIDLGSELKPNGISLTYEDVQQIIGIIYCAGTVEISPQRIESLLLISQVLGIPTLIRFIKHIKRSISQAANDEVTTLVNITAVERPSIGLGSKPGLQQPPPFVFFMTQSTEVATVNTTPTMTLSRSENEIKPHINLTTISDEFLSTTADTFTTISSKNHQLLPLIPPRPASIDSLTLEPLRSPSPCMTEEEPRHATKLVSIGLEGIDQSVLHGLEANQIDDLESALMPHLILAQNAKGVSGNNINVDQESETEPRLFTSSKCNDEYEDEFNRDAPNSTSLIEQQPLNLTLNNAKSLDNELPLDISDPVLGYLAKLQPVKRVANDNQELLSNFSTSTFTQERASLINMDGDQVMKDVQENGKQVSVSQKSPSISLSHLVENISTSISKEENIGRSFVSSSTTTTEEEDEEEGVENNDAANSRRNLKLLSKLRTKKYSAVVEDKFCCILCDKKFVSKRSLEVHSSYHNVQNNINACPVCGKIFVKKWLLDQHVAIKHESGGALLQCEECGKAFRWQRNLLAHLQIEHKKEVRYRCWYCPLSFLRRKTYINHHNAKHSKMPPTWCKFCHEIFDKKNGGLDHHDCAGIEATGFSFICHRHSKSVTFNKQEELLSHNEQFHATSKITSRSQLQHTCSVCSKKFMYRKNLNRHTRIFHASREENKSKLFSCLICRKDFYFVVDLESHLNVHYGRKKFKCDRCETAYSSEKAKIVHQKRVHDEPESEVDVTCKICQKRLSNKYKLRSHLRVHSDQRQFRCSLCHFKFKATENLIKHMNKFHAQKTPLSDACSETDKQ